MIVLLSCQEAAAPPAITFTDEAAARGITWVNHCGDPEKKRYLLEEMGNGCALFDCDGDGDLDLFLVDACRLEPPASGDDLKDDWRPVLATGGPDAGQCRLLVNDGRGRFSDVTDAAGAGLRAFANGATAADFDGDGDVDLFVTCWGPDHLLENDGKGKFTDVTERAGVGDPRWGVSAAFLDADRDGDLDLYVGNYVAMAIARDPKCWRKIDCPYLNVPVACGPKGMIAEPGAFYVNQGDGTFRDATAESGMGAVEARFALGVAAFDHDLDGDVDLYVGNDSRPNYLFDNVCREAGKPSLPRFNEIGDLAGVSVSRNGVAQASMGVAVGDFDGNGFPDLAVTNFSHDEDEIYANQGGGSFLDVTARMNLGPVAFLSLGWGTAFPDFDGDGALDFFVANGHVYPEADRCGPDATYRQRNLVYRNDGRRFVDVTDQAGPGLARKAAFRGAAFGDVDDDGDVDVVVMTLNEAPSLLINQLRELATAEKSAAPHWLLLALDGAGKNRSAIGASAVAEVGGRRLLRVVISGGSYASSSDPRLHFGWPAGAAAKIDRLTVTWPDGTTQSFEDVAGDRVVRLAQGGTLQELVRR